MTITANESVRDILKIGFCGTQINGILGATGVGVSTMLEGIAADLIGQLKSSEGVKQNDKVVLIAHRFYPGITRQKISRYLASTFLAPSATSQFVCLDSLAPEIKSAQHQVSNHLVLVDGLRDVLYDLEFPSKRHQRELYSNLSSDDSIRAIVVDELETVIESAIPPGCKDSHNLLAQFMGEYLMWLRRIAGVWQCPVWVGHKLKGIEGSRKPTEASSHYAADLWKGMGRYLDRAFVIGTHDNFGRFRLDQTLPSEQQSLPSVLKIADGVWFNHVSDDEYEDFFNAPTVLDQVHVLAQVHVDDQTMQAMSASAHKYRQEAANRDLASRIAIAIGK